LAALALLSGDPQAFREKCWGSQVHLHHADPDALTGLLPLDDVDRLLTESAIRTPAVRLARDGTVLPAAAYTRAATLAGQPVTGLVDARKVLDLFDAGASVVLQGLHRYWPPLTALVAELELELGHPCQANAYLTPPHSQGFAVHSDTHDVFVFQTHGRKTWEVHEDGEQRTIVMEPGVSMYLPTGTPHAARAEDVASLHVTLGINQVTWRRVLERAVRTALDSVDDGHLPAGYLDEPAVLDDGLAGRLRAVADAVQRLDPRAVTAEETRRFLSTRNPRLAGGLRDRLAARDLADDVPLRRRPGHPMRLQPAGDRLRVLLGDRELTVPAWLGPALREIGERVELRPADLADVLDPQSRIVLCRRLLREGLLEVVT
jgi:bifunctional lysine-specific demethylase and histidyl-hydroxylase NO66